MALDPLQWPESFDAIRKFQQDNTAIEAILFGLYITPRVTLLGMLFPWVMVRITTVAQPLPAGRAPQAAGSS